MRFLNMELSEDDGNLKLLALKLHMLLQRSWEYRAKGLEFCETLIPMAKGEDEVTVKKLRDMLPYGFSL